LPTAHIDIVSHESTAWVRDCLIK